MKKFNLTILCLVVLGIGYCIGYFFGSNDVFLTVDHHVVCWNKSMMVDDLRAIRSAQSDLLHRIYGNGDNEPWFDLVMSTPEYWRLDSVLNAAGCGWEDFYDYDEYTAGYADGDTIETPADYQY